jgi:hypothetical protein
VTRLSRVVGLRLGQDDATVERRGVKLDGQAGAGLVRPGRAMRVQNGFILRFISCF